MLSIVIPTLNAAAHLPACLAALSPGLPGQEIIVVDGGSTDETTAIASACATVISSEKGRANQMLAGAAAAQGQWLLFLHADTRLPDEWTSLVTTHTDLEMAGYFRFALDRDGWRPKMWQLGVAWRCRILALPYGDQGLLISRRLYDQVGGFRPLPFLEDVDLVHRLGRRRLRQLDGTAVTSAERFERDGYWRRSAKNLSIVAAFHLGVDAARLAAWYR